MAFTRDWDESTPTDATVANQIDDYNRYLRVDMSDRLKNMLYGLIAGENTLSQHFQYIQFYEQASVAQPSAAYGRLYCKAVGGKCELHWQDEDANEIQVTGAGKITGPDIDLAAGKHLTGSSTSNITWNTDKFTVAGATGNTVIGGTLALTGLATLTAGLTSPAAVVSTLATGTAPFTITSTTKVSNLNVDQVDGYDISAYSGGQSYTFPGGLIIKTGTATCTGFAGTISFGAAFPNAIVSVNTTGTSNSSGLVVHVDSSPAPSTTGFSVISNGSGASYYWIAIGY